MTLTRKEQPDEKETDYYDSCGGRGARRMGGGSGIMVAVK